MAKPVQASWKSALTPQKAPTYGNQGMLIASPKELQVSGVDYVVVFEGTKKYHVAIADIVNPYTLHVVIPEHDVAEEVTVKVFAYHENNTNLLTHLKFTYISQMEHAIAKFLAQSVSDAEVAEKLDAVWTVCLGKDHLELWDKRLAQAFAQLELPIEWTLVGDILQKENECLETLVHFAARHGLKDLINVFLNLPGAKQALSTYNKSGLLPRDVARENGRLDIAELLDTESSTEQRKSGTFKDSSRRKVRRNNENGVTTITNLKNRNVQEDIQFLREINKLKAKKNSPANRHSWPIKVQSFNPDDYLIGELEVELDKILTHGEQNNTKRSFIDDNLTRLRDIRDEMCNLRTRIAEESSKEISMIADKNRRPSHSRRLSCPSSVERRKRVAEGLPNLKSRPESSTSERNIGSPEEPTNHETAENIFSTPPISPPVGQLINLSSPTVTSPDPGDTWQQFDEPFMTPPSNTPSSSPLPPSPMPISLKYTEVERRPNSGRKGRPRTWYGGGAGIPPAEDEEFRRSNSLEDFAKALDEGSDDESLASGTSLANSKEGLLQTLSSLTEKESRTESFVSSISDVSIGKESVESDIESEHGDDYEHEYTQEDISEKFEDISGYERILEGEDEYTQEENEGDDGTEVGDSSDVEVHVGIQEDRNEVVEGYKDVDNRDIHEHEEVEMNEKLEKAEDFETHQNPDQITAGSDVESRDVESEFNDRQHEWNDSQHEVGDTQHECQNFEHVHDEKEQETKNSEHACGDVEHECKDTEHEHKDVEHECKDTEHEYKDAEHECKDNEHEYKDAEDESKDAEDESNDTEQKCGDMEEESRAPEDKYEDTVLEQEYGETNNENEDKNDLELEEIEEDAVAATHDIEKYSRDEGTQVSSQGTQLDNRDTQVDNHDTQADNHDTKVDNRDTQVDNRDTQVDNHGTQVDNHDTQVDNHGTQVDNRDTQVDNHNTQVDNYGTQVENHDTQVENHGAQVDNRGEQNGQEEAICNGIEGDVREPEEDEGHVCSQDKDTQNEDNENMDISIELSNKNEELQPVEDEPLDEHDLQEKGNSVEQFFCAGLDDLQVAQDLAKYKEIGESNENRSITLRTPNDNTLVEAAPTSQVAEDRPEVPEISLDETNKSGDLSTESDDRPTENESLSRQSEDHPAEDKDRPAHSEHSNESERPETNLEDRPTESGESERLPTETGVENDIHVNGREIVPDDAEDKSESTDDGSSLKIKYEDLNDIECEVQDFCLPGQNNVHNKELFRIQATDDVESGEDSDHGRHIRFDEKPPSVSPVSEERSPKSPENPFNSPMRSRSALLLKIPVKRSGSDVSVTSLQDVELDVHATNRSRDLSPGLNASRKAKSFGDLSTFSEGRSEMVKDEADDSEEERRRIQEDHTVLSRVKKYEQTAKYASNEHLEKISNSSIVSEPEDDRQGQRRWSNFFYSSSKNPKQGKKPGRTPTFRRDNLRSSMTSLGKGSKNSGKATIESLVVGQNAAAFAKHSQTAPSLHVTSSGRPRSYTKDSPGSIRKSPTVNPGDPEEQKTESPEEVEMPEIEFEVDSDLENFDQEPEAWSLTVEKDLVKKMKKNDVKRQDVIYELIQTEGHHVRTLKIMQQVFYRGLCKTAGYPTERLDELFPRINELVDISARFYRNLRCRQDESTTVRMIGDVIVKQFSGDNGDLVKDAYGEFVSKHQEAVALYKQHFKVDKKFSNFIKKCQSHRIVRRLSVPECFTLVTQRMTKYPLLIEAILKVTKSSNADYKELQKALFLVKDTTKAMNNSIKDYEKQSRLKDIKLRIEKGSVVLKNGVKIKNSRFVDYKSKMVHDGILQWKNARGKLTETHVVLLESIVAFLQENDKKYSLLSVDGKSPWIALKTLMVREVATDKCAIYFVSTSKKGPEMYEFVCGSQKEKRQWCTIITEAIAKAPEDTGDFFHSPEEEKRLAEERLKRRNEIVDIMKEKDKELSDLVDEKNKLVNELKELYHMPEGNDKTKEDQRVASNERARLILLSAINQTTQLTANTVLIHESHSDSELAATTHDKKASSPKRAETFGGFDRRPSHKGSRRTTTTIHEGKSEENNAVQRRDSGLSLASESVGSGESVVALNTLSQGHELGGSLSFQMLDALQWVLVQFSQQETKLESLRMEHRRTTEDIKKLRTVKIENDKKHFLAKEEHQAELTKQKKAYSDLERTFNSQVSDLKLQLKSQEDKQATLLQNFIELRRELTNK